MAGRRVLLSSTCLFILLNFYVPYRFKIDGNISKSMLRSLEVNDNHLDGKLTRLQLEIISTKSRHLGLKPRRKFHKARIKYYSNHTCCTTYQLMYKSTVAESIMLAGDIESNPGPVNQVSSTDKCSVCNRTVARNHRAIECDICSLWCHIKCGLVSPRTYREMMDTSNLEWKCPICIQNSNSSLSNNDILQDTRQEIPNTDLQGETRTETSHYSILAKEIQFGKNHLKIGHINVNGILTKAKLQEIHLLPESAKFDLFGLTESKLTSNNNDIMGYKYIRRDRAIEDGGGGCILYYIESLDVIEANNIYPSEWDQLEAIWVDIQLHSQRLLLSVMYRPPQDESFYRILETQLNYIWMKRKNIFIMGDLNSDLLKKRRQL